MAKSVWDEKLLFKCIIRRLGAQAALRAIQSTPGVLAWVDATQQLRKSKMKVFELLPRPLGNIFEKLTHLTCNSLTAL